MLWRTQQILLKKTEYKAALKVFEKNDSLAQLILVGNLNDANIELTSTCDTAKQVWDKLTSIYEQSSGQRVDRLMEQFFTFEKVSTEDIATHIGRLQRIFRELNDEMKRLLGTELPDLLLMSRIMSTLPHEYFEFKSVWESVSVEDRTVNKLTERLRLIEMRLPVAVEDNSTAFMAQKGARKSTRNELKCFKCHRIGHFAKNCPEKVTSKFEPRSASESKGDAFVNEHEEKNSWKDSWIIADSGATSDAIVNEHEENNSWKDSWIADSGATSDAIVNEHEEKNSWKDSWIADSGATSDANVKEHEENNSWKDSWIADSGATSDAIVKEHEEKNSWKDSWIADTGAINHMTYQKEYFVSFKYFPIPKSVRVGNHSTIMAYGGGRINVEMLINGRWEQNFLKDVWFVPKISRNLFSISQTVQHGFNFIATKKGCSLMKNKMVRMTGRNTGKGLYTLDMRVCMPKVAAEVYLANEEDTIQLWHERMCHQNKIHVKTVPRKLDKKGRKGRLVGHCDEKDGYRVWFPEKNQVQRSRDVVFIEESHVRRTVEFFIKTAGQSEDDNDKKFEDQELKSIEAEVDANEEENFKDHEDKDMKNKAGSVDTCKARPVAKDYLQKYGIDYDEIFGPVARLGTVRSMLGVEAAGGDGVNSDIDLNFESKVPYQEAMGSLMYLVQGLIYLLWMVRL